MSRILLPVTSRIAAGLPLLLAAVLGTACTFVNTRVPPHPGMDAMWREYSKLPPQRALAVAGDPNRLWVAGVAGGAETQDAASEAALGECRRKRAERSMQVPCLLYAVGDRIVWPVF